MKQVFPARAVVAGLVVAALGSCAATPSGPGGDGFKTRYFAARTALEGGDYAGARRGYLRLIEDAGPLAPRLRLEYAHAALRAERWAEAAAEADALARSGTGMARGAALAVRGTAQHELGAALLAEGRTDEGAALLRAAQEALSEVVARHPDLDPLGSMAGREAAIRARLGRL